MGSATASRTLKVFKDFSVVRVFRDIKDIRDFKIRISQFRACASPKDMVLYDPSFGNLENLYGFFDFGRDSMEAWP